MTLPTRPAPAPPGSRAQNAAANANASLEQLRLQLQQQQQLQRQNVTVPKLTIKLPPPPPKGPLSNGFANSNNNSSLTTAQGSITRKFPQARYAPATDWDDSPFDVLNGTQTTTVPTPTNATNGNYKKPPPPRPPPPKVQPKKPSAPAAPASSILSSIFHRKKTSRAPTPNSASRVYGAATYGTTTITSSSSTSTTSSTSHSNTFNQTSWNNAWNTTPNCAAVQHTLSASSSSTTTAEGQLISFDSPPSSPTFTQKSNSDCLSVDSFSSDSNFSSPNNGSVSQPESGFEDDFSANNRSSRPATVSPMDPWETLDAFGHTDTTTTTSQTRYGTIGTAPVRNLNVVLNSRINANANAAGDNPLCNGKSLLPPAPSLNMPTIIKPKISQKPKAPRPPALAKPNTGGSAQLYNDNLITPPSPPMPQCAPPPPPPAAALGSVGSGIPSLLDVISGKVDALHLYPGEGAGGDAVQEQPYGIALYEFNSTEDGDLCFRENEKIYLLEQVSPEWYRGRLRSGCEGIFPANYIEIKVPLRINTNISSNKICGGVSSSSYQTSECTTTSVTTTTTYQSNTNSNKYGMQIKSIYNFPAEVQGDLELKENDLVTILYRINEDWLYGEINGRQGQFPANFLEYVPSNIPMP